LQKTEKGEGFQLKISRSCFRVSMILHDGFLSNPDRSRPAQGVNAHATTKQCH
jgi:hypothetical protein